MSSLSCLDLMYTINIKDKYNLHIGSVIIPIKITDHSLEAVGLSDIDIKSTLVQAP